MEIFDKIRQILRFLVVLITMDCDGRTGSHTMRQKRLITTAVFEYDVIVYVKGHEKRMWLWNLLDDERERIYIETLDAVYEDMESLINLDVANTMRCGQYVKYCALQNILKIYN